MHVLYYYHTTGNSRGVRSLLRSIAIYRVYHMSTMTNTHTHTHAQWPSHTCLHTVPLLNTHRCWHWNLQTLMQSNTHYMLQLQTQVFRALLHSSTHKLFELYTNATSMHNSVLSCGTHHSHTSLLCSSFLKLFLTFLFLGRKTFIKIYSNQFDTSFIYTWITRL